MWESMKLIEKANHLKKKHHRKHLPDRASPKNDNLKSLSVTVYSSRHLISTQKQNVSYRSDEQIFPPIESHNQRKKKRPFYRSSLYHPGKVHSNEIDLSSLTARGTKSELLTTTLREDELIKEYEHHHAPPPSPSDDQLERFLYEFNRARNSSPCSITHQDGQVPYRLPALKKPNRRTNSELTYPSQYVNTTTSNYFETFY
ncbi:unnamed protein product [Rotaria magnacalcarata]|uniref:Uncharacterized protein n=2 Tax=Rotaria magnacalcarata TaxID=392030 RepID=A0A820AP25_9BILA|nr:unnamed protein product [Rotaria magnacalcarata]CAF1653571.1 unnamed protein product [Rotaria magnacalcarata]CAF2036082.1 unnamed protein product [Rotaria magnacalcarata]CAF2047689.1 unnamed protein product [Rotaria magnacalcarata]CAF3787712.1 unnamed protein product [Rotaria magnacalcarata]